MLGSNNVVLRLDMCVIISKRINFLDTLALLKESTTN